jgi:hypothetical protein
MRKKQFDIQELENNASILKEIANNYSKRSAEYKAMMLAAKALIFACEYQVELEFEAFLRKWGKKLPAKEIAHLKRMGLITVDAHGKMQSKFKTRRISDLLL